MYVNYDRKKSHWIIHYKYENYFNKAVKKRDKSKSSDRACQIWILPIDLLLVFFLFCFVNWLSQHRKKVCPGYVMLKMINQSQKDKLLSDKFPHNKTKFILWRWYIHFCLCVFILVLFLWTPSSPFHQRKKQIWIFLKAYFE